MSGRFVHVIPQFDTRTRTWVPSACIEYYEFDEMTGRAHGKYECRIERTQYAKERADITGQYYNGKKVGIWNYNLSGDHKYVDSWTWNWCPGLSGQVGDVEYYGSPLSNETGNSVGEDEIAVTRKYCPWGQERDILVSVHSWNSKEIHGLLYPVEGYGPPKPYAITTSVPEVYSITIFCKDTDGQQITHYRYLNGIASEKLKHLPNLNSGLLVKAARS